MMNTVQLTIIAKTRMNNGFCYIGLFPNNNLVRPIPRATENECCWFLTHLEVGEQHCFQVLDSVPQVSYPHKVNDILVKYLCREEPPGDIDLFGVLRPLSHEIMRDVFGGEELIDGRYVEEGSMCPSVGIYRCHRDNIVFYRNDEGKSRCKITDNGRVFDFRMTASSWEEDTRNKEVLVMLGLGRPFRGTEGHSYNPRRCYALVVGLVGGTNIMPLRIIGKCRTSSAVWYIGLNGDRLVWPVPQYGRGWTGDNFKVGEVHNFEVLDGEARTSHPHKGDEVPVQHRARMPGVEPAQNVNLFHTLCPLSHERVKDVFTVPLIEKRYVTEGTCCTSVGIYRCKRGNILCFQSEFGKTRCKIRELNYSEENHTVEYFEFPAHMENGAMGRIEDDDEVLLILVLCRPFAGQQVPFNRRRCYVLVIGIVTQETQQ